MNIYECNYSQESSAYIQAENLNHAISRAKRLGRLHFNTQKVYVKHVYSPSNQQTKSAEQAHYLLNEPFVSSTVGLSTSKPAVIEHKYDNLWQQMAAQLDEAGL